MTAPNTSPLPSEPRMRVGAPVGHRTYTIVEVARGLRARCVCGAHFETLAGLDMHHHLIRWGVR